MLFCLELHTTACALISNQQSVPPITKWLWSRLQCKAWQLTRFLVLLHGLTELPCLVPPAGFWPDSVHCGSSESRFSAPSADYSAPRTCANTHTQPGVTIILGHFFWKWWSKQDKKWWGREQETTYNNERKDELNPDLWFWLSSSPILRFCSSMRELFSNTSFFRHSFSWIHAVAWPRVAKIFQLILILSI